MFRTMSKLLFTLPFKSLGSVSTILTNVFFKKSLMLTKAVFGQSSYIEERKKNLFKITFG